MKTWQPDADFEKADFPIKKKGAAKPPADPPDSRPATGAAPATSMPPAKKTPETKTKSTTAGGLGVWQPEAIDTASATHVVRSRAEPDDSAPPGPTRTGGPTTGPTQQQKPPREGQLPVRLLQESCISVPENTLRLLRKWFWEKWPPPPGAAEGVRAMTPPHDRIRIILVTVGPKIQQYLFQLMSPVERGKFNEVVRGPMHFSPITINMVVRDFMQGLREDRL